MQARRQSHRGVIERVAGGLPEKFVEHEVGIILRADEVRRLQHVEFAKTEIKRNTDGDQREGDKPDQPGRKERHAFTKLTDFAVHFDP